MPTGEHCWKKKKMAHRGREPATFVFQVHALSTALPRKIYEVGFKHCTVHRYSIATMLHVTAEPRGRPVASIMIVHLLKQKIFNEIGIIICSHILLHAQ